MTYDRESTSQPYASYLANHLDAVRKFNGGGQFPPPFMYVTDKDQKWLLSYFRSLDRDPHRG